MLAFAFALLVTGALVASVATAIGRQDRLNFEHEVSQATEAITERVIVTSSLLRATRGLFQASDDVSADEFRRYVDTLDLRNRYPGILGIGFSRRLAPDEVAPFVRAVRASGRPAFHVWPAGPRAEYHAIVYLEPLDRRNAAAIGYDMSTEPVRRAAMEAARREGEIVASGRVTLVQEIDPGKQAGLLLYLPIYANASAGARGPFLGFVYAPLRAGDLLAGTRGPGTVRIDYQAFDGTRADPAALLRSTFNGPPPAARFVTDRMVQVAGRPWLLRFYSRPALDELSRHWLVPWLALAAVVASGLLALLSQAQVRQRSEAEAATAAQRQASETLRRERAFLGATLNSIGDGVVAVDARGRVAWMNPVAERLTGHDREQALGRPLQEVVHVTGIAEPEAGARMVEHGRGEAMLHAPDGGMRPVGYSSAPIGDALGGMSGAVIVIRDMSERLRIEAELRDNDRRKDEFLAMLAHELRNPLAPISTAATLLRLPEASPGLVHDASEIISRQVAHMIDLVDDLIEVSRVTRGLIALARETFDLREALHAAVEQSRPLVRARRHVFSEHIARAPLWVHGDRTRLTQVVVNLLDNAAKYTPSGGRIELDAGIAGDVVRVCVRDTGVGIDPGLLPRLFDLFAQGERPPDRSQGGLGIGLALVRKLVELHGGTVRGDSAGAGSGSTFVVELPRAEAPAAAGPASPPATATGPAPQARQRIVLVDDNQDALQTIAFLLRAHGHAVATHGDAEAALEAMERGRDPPADLYLLDIGLPGMDGHALARRLRADPRTARATLVALSGYGQAADIDASFAAGFDAHLVKPVDAERLLGLLRDLDAVRTAD